MGITSEELSRRHPTLYHMAEGGAWPSIERHGLLSTAALLDLFGISGDARTAIESRHRPESVVIRHPTLGDAVIRDQKPIQPGKLERCLDGCTPAEWYAFVNARVYFWLTRERVDELAGALAYRGTERTILTIATAPLLACYGPRVLLSPINSGSTLYQPVRRGISTFQPMAAYPYEERKRLRGPRRAIAELTVDYAIPDISRFVRMVETI
jgi:uncharacterized protein DUF7002